MDTGVWYPSSVGASSAQGYGDRYYAGGTNNASGFREWLCGGFLGGGSLAGSVYLYSGNGLTTTGWYYLAAD